MNETDGSSRIRSVAANILIFLPGFGLMVSSILKFAGVPAVVHQMASAGFTDGRLTLVAGLELLAALLFLYPRTRFVGVLFLSAFLGGAVCSHVQMGELPKALGPSLFLAFAWSGTWLRYPEMLWGVSQTSTERATGRRSDLFRTSTT